MFCASNIFAQQTPLYSLYTFNSFNINPAVATANNYYTAQINNRYQFIGIENAPITATLNVYGPSKTMPMAWGGTIFNDSQGALGKFGVYGSYAYELPLTADIDLSMGLHAGVIQYTVDMTKVKFLDEETRIDENTYTSIKPDATLGFYAHSKDYFVGLSFDQLFNNKIQIIEDTLVVNETPLNRLKTHYTLVGGYNVRLSSKIMLEPTIVFRKTAKAPMQVELTGKVSYNKIAWGGATVRSSDAVVILIGYNYRNSISFGYGYDITYSALRKDTGGAHEVMIAFNFNKVK